jgi:hypothetical protein
VAAAGTPECTWARLLPRSFGPRTSRSLLSATVGVKPTISGSNAFGVGPDQSPSDRYPPQVADAESQRPELSSACPCKADGLTTRCRNAASRSDTRAFAGMHRCPLHHRGVEIVRMHNDVDHLLNNNRITAGIITAALRREGAAMCNGHLADPVSTRERLSQNLIHNRRIVGVPTALVPLFPNPAA